ncbi:hypothetical protein [Kribbella sp. NPDC000426]|uniref:hypothetical protein n=1 Tax=Kribbella sp. NPDC000426 TaxID=3154255 RepID=UPI00331F8A6B
MGTAEDEARARDELERVRTENAIREMERQRALEEYRKQQEQQNNKMVADPEQAAPNWPDDGFQAAAPGRLHGVKAALAIGAPGDAALAAKLLNTGHAPAGSAAPSASADGAKESVGGAAPARATGPALGY